MSGNGTNVVMVIRYFDLIYQSEVPLQFRHNLKTEKSLKMQQKLLKTKLAILFLLDMYFLKYLVA